MPDNLVTHNLSAGYGQMPVVRTLNCACPPGQLTSLLGANGAGKTTLLRALSGYLPLSGGSIQLGEIALSALKPRQRARYIASVPQVTQELLPLTVRQAVAMARYPHLTTRMRLNGVDGSAIDSALTAMHLHELAGRQCGSLSGGEWRRVLIAQGLAQETAVLLLDEPTAFLDPPAQRQILAHLRDLAAKRGLVVIAVLHDISLARAFANQALLLRDGALLAAGAPADVLTEDNLTQLYSCEPQWLTVEVL